MAQKVYPIQLTKHSHSAPVVIPSLKLDTIVSNRSKSCNNNNSNSNSNSSNNSNSNINGLLSNSPTSPYVNLIATSNNLVNSHSTTQIDIITNNNNNNNLNNNKNNNNNNSNCFSSPSTPHSTSISSFSSSPSLNNNNNNMINSLTCSNPTAIIFPTCAGFITEGNLEDCSFSPKIKTVRQTQDSSDWHQNYFAGKSKLH
eukprot:TRINITY_DN2924_c0_g1_i2.p1 TRINITY_DN2924_c0_g1~~TRINITY_DN2924_c0_g1_i2.p1  ORF type:complete len:200 (+),score=93.49 TRINITY_DN2924_c0_g1_i2:39-638(+)